MRRGHCPADDARFGPVPTAAPARASARASGSQNVEAPGQGKVQRDDSRRTTRVQESSRASVSGFAGAGKPKSRLSAVRYKTRPDWLAHNRAYFSVDLKVMSSPRPPRPKNKEFPQEFPASGNGHGEYLRQ
jgi:hypothetical protein